MMEPSTTICGACTSPLTTACADSVSIAWGPLPRIAPSILPSICRRPLKLMSPLISVPVAISVVASAAFRASFRLVLNIDKLLCSERVVPGEFLFGATAVAAGSGLDMDAIRREIVRQHQRTGDLLEILERERQSGCVLIRRDLGP